MRWHSRKLLSLVLGLAVAGGAGAGDTGGGGGGGRSSKPLASPSAPQPKQLSYKARTQIKGSSTQKKINPTYRSVPRGQQSNANLQQKPKFQGQQSKKQMNVQNLKAKPQSFKPQSLSLKNGNHPSGPLDAKHVKGCLPATFNGWSRCCWSNSCNCMVFCNPGNGWWYYFYPSCNCFLPCKCINDFPPNECPSPDNPTPGPDNPTPSPDNPTPNPDDPPPGPDDPPPGPDDPPPGPDDPPPAPDDPPPSAS